MDCEYIWKVTGALRQFSPASAMETGGWQEGPSISLQQQLMPQLLSPPSPTPSSWRILTHHQSLRLVLESTRMQSTMKYLCACQKRGLNSDGAVNIK